MRKTVWWMVIICFCICFTGPSPATATDCNAIKSQIKKERNLLKKRQLLNGALETCPQDAEVHYICAYTAERLRKYDKALSNYLKATEIDRDYAKAYFGLGDIYMVLGNAESAMHAYQSGLSLEPGNTRAKSSMELAQIKYKAATGSNITSEEFIRVMEESKDEETTEGAIDGPLLRMQIHFYVASSQLTEKAVSQLEIVGKALESPALMEKKFEISGHTDDSGTPETNMFLSKERAEQVRNYLLKNFAVLPENLIVAYYGDTRPAAPNTSTENRALNRRVEFKRLKQ